MTDIVKRLCAPVSDDDDYMIGQWPGEPPKKYDALRLEAADEIECLRQVLENAQHARVLQGKTIIDAANEIERLRAALHRIGLPRAKVFYCRDGHEEAVLIARAALETREAGVSSEVKHD